MNQLGVLALAALAATAAAAAMALDAQTKTNHVKIAVIAPRPQDVSSPEAIVRASFEVESGPVGVARDWAREQTLYDPAGLFVAAGRDPETGALEPRRRTFQEYVDMMDAYSVQTGFVDKPLGCVTARRKYVATVTCGYEAREGAKVIERGVDMFQLYSDGKRWWILSVVWDKEEPGNPIPAELLHGRQ